MLRAIDIKRYIKNTFGMNIKIKVVSRLTYGAAGWANYDTNTITIVQRVLRDNCFKYLIWHEVGHFKTLEFCGGSRVEREVNAQLWAMNEMKRRGYNRMFDDAVDYVRAWPNIIKDKTYKKASKIILKIAGIE